MSNSTPSTPPPGEQAREQAEAALGERGWNPIRPYQLWEGELAVGRSADDAFEVSLWSNPDADPRTPWLCDVGVAPPDPQKGSLWIFGIPLPEEAPALLMEHADILSAGHDGQHSLDLATGVVLNAEQTRRRRGLATLAEMEAKLERKIAPIRKTLQAAWRTLGERGWETYKPSYSVGRTWDDTRRTVEIMATPYCKKDDGVLLLDLIAYYDDTGKSSGGDVWSLHSVLDSDTPVLTGIPLEYYGKARSVLEFPGGTAEIPTPREAMRLIRGE